jgi:acyl-CoA dehydrogenase
MRSFVDECLLEHMERKLGAEKVSMAKWWFNQKQCDIIDECLQLHGGYGYMWEYPIARLYADSRVQKIYGGTNEVMKELISRFL